MEDKHVSLAEFNQLFGIQVQDSNCITKHCLHWFSGPVIHNSRNFRKSEIKIFKTV